MNNDMEQSLMKFRHLNRQDARTVKQENKTVLQQMENDKEEDQSRRKKKIITVLSS